MFDVIIIGAGITGAMTAYRLARYRLNVALIEAGEDVASGTTKANSAIVHAGYDALPGTRKAACNVKGCAEMEKITEALGVHYKKCGSLVVGFDDADRAHLEKLLDRGIQNGVEGLRIVERDELIAMEPALADNALCALYAPSAGIVCPYDLAIAAAENAVTNGAVFVPNCKITSLVWDGDAFSASDGRQTIRARYVVNAAGLHADEVAAAIGDALPFTILPRRGEYLMLDKSVGGRANHTLFVTPSAKGKGILVSPTVDGNLIVGPNANLVEDKSDTDVTPSGIAEISAGARRLIPDLELNRVITSFAGVRATPTSDDFYLAPSEKYPRLIHAAGIESPGLASSPAIADVIVSLLADAGLALEERPDYIPTRGKEGNFKRFNDMTADEKRAAIAKDPAYAKIICRCETVTEGDILCALRRPIPAVSLDMVKRRVRAGMGRCQGGFCSPRVTELIAEETGKPLDSVTKRGGSSTLLFGRTKG